MSMNYDDRTPHPGPGMGSDDSVTESELMPSVPIWEQRAKKRRGFGARRASTADTAPTPAPIAADEPRSFAEPAPRLDEPVHSDLPHMDARRHEMNAAATGAALGAGTAMGSDPMAESMAIDAETRRLEAERGIMADDAREDVFVAPPPRTTTTARRSGAAPAAVALGVLALAGLGAAGWYAANHNADNGVPELTAGSPAPVASTAPPVMASNESLPSASATVPATAQPRATLPTARSTTVTRTTRMASARTRPATANSAAEAGISASGTATLPGGPQPYAPSTTATPDTSATSPTTVNPTPAPTTPPVEAAPNTTTPEPAPTTTTPDTSTPPTP